MDGYALQQLQKVGETEAAFLTTTLLMNAFIEKGSDDYDDLCNDTFTKGRRRLATNET